ncbi:MprA protease, GlyGly-CTERM protein-sorting domain-containing form [Alteriqipengyuania sp. 357]
MSLVERGMAAPGRFESFYRIGLSPAPMLLLAAVFVTGTDGGFASGVPLAMSTGILLLAVGLAGFALRGRRRDARTGAELRSHPAERLRVSDPAS